MKETNAVQRTRRGEGINPTSVRTLRRLTVKCASDVFDVVTFAILNQDAQLLALGAQLLISNAAHDAGPVWRKAGTAQSEPCDGTHMGGSTRRHAQRKPATLPHGICHVTGTFTEGESLKAEGGVGVVVVVVVQPSKSSHNSHPDSASFGNITRW